MKIYLISSTFEQAVCSLICTFVATYNLNITLMAIQSTQKIALITGGSRGLGKGMAEALAARGTDIIITYRTEREKADEVVSAIAATGRRAAAHQLDAGEIASLDNFVAGIKEQLAVWGAPGLDYVVNNAGMGAGVPIQDVTEQLWDDMHNVHLKTVFFLTQKLLPTLQDGGAIVNISTGTTRFVNPGYVAYATMKGGLEVMTKYLAKELGPRQIKVNVVAPGGGRDRF